MSHGHVDHQLVHQVLVDSAACHPLLLECPHRFLRCAQEVVEDQAVRTDDTTLGSARD
jgi:hypothetical protein